MCTFLYIILNGRIMYKCNTNRNKYLQTFFFANQQKQSKILRGEKNQKNLEDIKAQIDSAKKYWFQALHQTDQVDCQWSNGTKLPHMETDYWHVHPLFPYALLTHAAVNSHECWSEIVIKVYDTSKTNTPQTYRKIWHNRGLLCRGAFECSSLFC